MACLSYLSLPPNINPLSSSNSNIIIQYALDIDHNIDADVDVANISSIDTKYNYKDILNKKKSNNNKNDDDDDDDDDNNLASIGPFLIKVPESGSGKEMDMLSLGSGVCSALCALIDQVACLISFEKKNKSDWKGNNEVDGFGGGDRVEGVETVEEKQERGGKGDGGEKEKEVEEVEVIGCEEKEDVDDIDQLENSKFNKINKTDDLGNDFKFNETLTGILIDVCSAIESIVMSHYSHRLV